MVTLLPGGKSYSPATRNVGLFIATSDISCSCPCTRWLSRVFCYQFHEISVKVSDYLSTYLKQNIVCYRMDVDNFLFWLWLPQCNNISSNNSGTAEYKSFLRLFFCVSKNDIKW